MQHFLVVEGDQEQPALEALDPRKRDNPVDFPPGQFLELADEDKEIMLGVRWLESQPEAVQEARALLPHPEKLTIDGMVEGSLEVEGSLDRLA